MGLPTPVLHSDSWNRVMRIIYKGSDRLSKLYTDILVDVDKEGTVSEVIQSMSRILCNLYLDNKVSKRDFTLMQLKYGFDNFEIVRLLRKLDIERLK